MAKRQSLANMSMEALEDLRENISRTLTQRAAELRNQLERLTEAENASAGERRRGRGQARASPLKGRKVAPKYRSKKNPKMTWSGRGGAPRWMRDEMKAGKLKKEAFLLK